MKSNCIFLVILVGILRPNNGEELSLIERFRRENKVYSNSLTGDIHEEIWNGLNATNGQFPYQALILNNAFSGTTVCGASLISQRYLLTAGHCSYGTYSTDVYLGVTNVSDNTGRFYKNVPSYNTYIHPKYNPSNFQNDLSILDLGTNVTLSNTIQVIKLPMKAWAPPATYDNYNVTASGFGQTRDNEQGYHAQLQYRTIHKMVQTDCITYYKNINNVTDGMICTDKTPTYAGPCHGDSGGPLVIDLAQGKFLLGAVSWAAGNCSSPQPIVYANVPYYLDWINQRTGIPIS